MLERQAEAALQPDCGRRRLIALEKKVAGAGTVAVASSGRGGLPTHGARTSLFGIGPCPWREPATLSRTVARPARRGAAGEASFWFDATCKAASVGDNCSEQHAQHAHGLALRGLDGPFETRSNRWSSGASSCFVSWRRLLQDSKPLSPGKALGHANKCMTSSRLKDRASTNRHLSVSDNTAQQTTSTARGVVFRSKNTNGNLLS